MSIDRNKKSRLGRGLSSLIGVDPGVTPTFDETIEAPPLPDVSPQTPTTEVGIEQVSPNPRQPRRAFDEAALNELAASIQANGLIQPIVVRRVGQGYELIAGERRLRAAKLAGLTRIPVVVREADDLTQAQLALVENIQRQDLNPIERAEGYHALQRELGLTQAELGTRLGEDRSTISNHLRLLDLALPVRDLVRDGKLSLGHAKVLCGVADPAEQQRLADLAIQQELTVRNLERVLATPAPVEAKPAEKASPYQRDLDANLTKQVGLRVQVRASGKKGKVVIHYGSLDEFDALLEKLGVRLDD